jgi:hypothetical protein
MSLVSDVIAEVRVEIADTDSTRFTDDTTVILPMVKQGIRRANRICQRAQLHFAKKSAALVTVANQAYVDAPVDLDIPIGLWRDDLHQKIVQKTESEWEQIITASAVANWFLDLQNSRILLNAAPTGVMNLTLWYFPTIDPSAYTVASTMPWGGKLDDIIARYVALRIQNIEEQNTAQDQAILNDMEASIISVYAPQSPLTVKMDGWL